MEDAKTLLNQAEIVEEVAKALRAWRELILRKSPETASENEKHDATQKLFAFIARHATLLRRLLTVYGCNEVIRPKINSMLDLVSDFKSGKDLGGYWSRVDDYAGIHPYGEKYSVPDELDKWVQELKEKAANAEPDKSDKTLPLSVYIEQAIGLLEKAEPLRREAQRRIQNGEDPGSAAEVNLLKRQFDHVINAGELVQVAYGLHIDAATLDDFIRTGNPALVSGAIHVLRQIQAEALRCEAGLAKKPQAPASPPDNTVGNQKGRRGTKDDAKKAKPASIFKQIADLMRTVRERNPGKIIDAEKEAGHLFAEAIDKGGFARLQHKPLRVKTDEQIEKAQYEAVFYSAVYWFKQFEPHWPAVSTWKDLGSDSNVINGCRLLADVIEAEADVPETERILSKPVPGRLTVITKVEELQRQQQKSKNRERSENMMLLSGRIPKGRLPLTGLLPATSPPVNPRRRVKKHDPGRKPLKSQEEERRKDIIKRYRNRGDDSAAQFCTREGISLEELDNILSWERGRKRKKKKRPEPK